MKIKTFQVEEWMNTYENDAIYNLAETCIDSLTVRELLILAGKQPEDYMKSLTDTRLSYSHIYGSPELLENICKLFQADVAPDDVVVTHGAAGANHQLIITLLGPGDHMICVAPTYQQHYSIPESVGAEVSLLLLREENQYLPDLEELKQMIRPNTKLITINNPNNPTGSLMDRKALEDLAKIAGEAGIYILDDEVYRGVSEDGSYMPSIVDVYEKGISVGSMSKSFSLAGLRLGWIVSKQKDLIRLCKERRDYDTISVGVLDDKFAALALAHKDAIFERNRNIVVKNRKILVDWVAQEPRVHFVPPKAGNTALVYYDADISSREFCTRILREQGVFFTPGECFDLEYCFRIGYAFDAKRLKEGLEKTSQFLALLPERKK